MKMLLKVWTVCLQQHAVNAVTWVGLGVLGLWGHHTEWRMIAAAGPVRGQANAREAAAPSFHQDAGRVLFASRHAWADLGIAVGGVVRRQIVDEIVAPGELVYDATRRAQLSTRVPGTVWRIEKQLGDAVRRGEVLVLIEAPDIGRLKAEFLQAAVQRDLKSQVLERLEAAGPALPEMQRRTAAAELREAQIRLSNAQQTLVNHGLPISLADLRGLSDAQMSDRVRYLGLPDKLRAELEATKATANLIPIRAPFDGLIIASDLTLGERVSPEALQLEVADLSTMWIQVGVRNEDAAKVALGQPITFTPAAGGEAFTAQVDWISTSVDRITRTLQVRGVVRRLDATKPLPANTFGTGRIHLKQRTTLVVPTSAIQWVGATPVVFEQMSPVAFDRRTVELGATSDDVTEIVHGLAEGSIVAATGGHALKAVSPD